MAGRMAGRIAGRIAGKLKLIVGKVTDKLNGPLDGSTMGHTAGRSGTVRANPEEQESNRTTATPAVDSSIAGETRHTVIEP